MNQRCAILATTLQPDSGDVDLRCDMYWVYNGNTKPCLQPAQTLILVGLTNKHLLPVCFACAERLKIIRGNRNVSWRL